MTNISWQKELAELIETAKTPQDKVAINAFANALSPFLDKPDLLRTLLGKIQRRMIDGAVNIIATEKSFESIDELRKQLPEDVEVITL